MPVTMTGLTYMLFAIFCCKCEECIRRCTINKAPNNLPIGFVREFVRSNGQEKLAPVAFDQRRRELVAGSVDDFGLTAPASRLAVIATAMIAFIVNPSTSEHLGLYAHARQQQRDQFSIVPSQDEAARKQLSNRLAANVLEQGRSRVSRPSLRELGITDATPSSSTDIADLQSVPSERKVLGQAA